MKHIPYLDHIEFALVFNPKEKILLKNLNKVAVQNWETAIIRDKEHLRWRRQHDRKRLDIELKTIEFFRLLDSHGYDVFDSQSTKDSNARVSAFRQLNELSKAEAIVERRTSFNKYSGSTICKCGDWFFCIWLEQEEEISINYDNIAVNGGKRPGAGRKSQFDKLVDKETATIRVPASKKEEIKALIDWLIEMEAAGKEVYSALWHARYILEQDEYRKEENAKCIELLEELDAHLPRFVIEKPDD